MEIVIVWGVSIAALAALFWAFRTVTNPDAAEKEAKEAPVPSKFQAQQAARAEAEAEAKAKDAGKPKPKLPGQQALERTTKAELVKLGAQYGIKLDQKKVKAAIIKELKDEFKKLK